MLLMLSEKGKYAAATQHRRTVWEKIIWPLILELNDVVFSLKQYQKKRDQVCTKNNLKISEMSRGLVSLLQKGIIIKEKTTYSIHYRLIAYMRLNAECDYATALKSITSGRGMFSQEFSHYEDMPHGEAEKVKSDYQASRASGSEE